MVFAKSAKSSPASLPLMSAVPRDLKVRTGTFYPACGRPVPFTLRVKPQKVFDLSGAPLFDHRPTTFLRLARLRHAKGYGHQGSDITCQHHRSRGELTPFTSRVKPQKVFDPFGAL